MLTSPQQFCRPRRGVDAPVRSTADWVKLVHDEIQHMFEPRTLADSGIGTTAASSSSNPPLLPTRASMEAVVRSLLQKSLQQQHSVDALPTGGEEGLNDDEGEADDAAAEQMTKLCDALLFGDRSEEVVGPHPPQDVFHQLDGTTLPMSTADKDSALQSTAVGRVTRRRFEQRRFAFETLHTLLQDGDGHDA